MSKKRRNPEEYDKHMLLITDAALEIAMGIQPAADQIAGVCKRVYDEILQEYKFVPADEILNMVLKSLKEFSLT